MEWISVSAVAAEEDNEWISIAAAAAAEEEEHEQEESLSEAW